MGGAAVDVTVTYFSNEGVATVFYVAANDEPVLRGIYPTLDAAFAAAQPGDTVQLLDDVVQTSTIVVSQDLTFDLGGCTVTAADGLAKLFTADAGNVVVTNGTFVGRVNAYDATTLTIAANTTVNGYVVVWGDGTYGQSGCKTPTLNVYGTVNSTVDNGDGAIVTNGTDPSKPVINVFDGASVVSANENGIYLPSGELNVMGGAITGATAVYVKSGTANISGGILTGTGDAAEYAFNGNGGDPTGDALVVDNCGYPNGEPAVQVTGGTIISANAQSVASYAKDANYTPVDDIIPGTVNGQPNPAQFSDRNADGLADGYMLVKDGSYYSVVKAWVVSWVVAGDTVQTNVVAEGTTQAEVEALAPANPTPGDGSISKFTGWQPPVSGPVEGDVVYTAQFQTLSGISIADLTFTSIRIDGSKVTATFTATIGEGVKDDNVYFDNYDVLVKGDLADANPTPTAATLTLGEANGQLDGTGVVEVSLPYGQAFLVGLAAASTNPNP